MLNKKLMAWGLGGMLVVFGLLNMWPYLILSRARTALDLEVVEITTEDGSRMDFVERGGKVGRELARDLADILKVRNEEVADAPETYFAEVLLHNKSNNDIRLLEADFRIRIDGIDAAKGRYKRKNALRIPAHGRERVLLPFELTLSLGKFSKLIENNIRATVVGEVWLPRAKHKIRLDFERDISLAQFDI